MKDILADIDLWLQAGVQVAVARVIDVEGSAPRQSGAAMAVTADNSVAGSVSGGCVEGAVVSEALQILASGERRILTFGYSDAEALNVGLTCGGVIRLFIEPLDWLNIYEQLRTSLTSSHPVALATVVDGPYLGSKLLVCPHGRGGRGFDSFDSGVHAYSGSSGSGVYVQGDSFDSSGSGVYVHGELANTKLARVIERDSRAALGSARNALHSYGVDGEARRSDVTVFIESFASPPTMLLCGAVDFTAALVEQAKLVGYRVVVCDARAVFATSHRFPKADQIVVSWPDRFINKIGEELGVRDAVCILTHDAKFDVPAIVAALTTGAGYIGVMGSRRAHQERFTRLTEYGVSKLQLKRLKSPIGLDLGAVTPQETAVSIMAEIIADRYCRNAGSLSHSKGPIHNPYRTCLDPHREPDNA